MKKSGGIQGERNVTFDQIGCVKHMIELSCSRLGLPTPLWSPHWPILEQLEGTRIVKERCSLEYPKLGKTGHFLSGVVISIEVMVHGDVCLGFRPTTEPAGSHVPTGPGLFSLGDVQDWMSEESSHHPQVTWPARFDAILDSVIKRAFRADEENLEGYREKMFR